MRHENLYLQDILNAADAIERFCESTDEQAFLQDELRQSAVLQKLIVIGEAAARLSDEFKHRHSEIEWVDIVGFRNFAVHEYFAILWTIVWETAMRDVPDLREKILAMIEAE